MSKKGALSYLGNAQLIAVFVIIVLLLSFVPIYNYFRGHTKDYGKLYRTGQITLHNGDIYTKRSDGMFQFIYPTTAAVLLAPPSSLGLLPFIIIFILINTAAWIASILLSVYLAAGKALRQPLLLYLIPSLCCIPFMWDIYLLGQPNLFLLACMLGALSCLRLKKVWCTGALIALATGIKAFPVLSIVYLIYRKHWKAVLFTILFLCFFLVLLPTPFRGFYRNLEDIRTWSNGMIFSYNSDSIAQRPGHGYSWKNHSLTAVANRLLRPVNAFESHEEPVCVNIAHLNFTYTNIIIFAIGLSLCLFYITSMPLYTLRTAHSDSIEYAILLLLILMLTPLSFTYFYVWLLYPFTVIWNIIVTACNQTRTRNVVLIWFIVCLLLLSLRFPIPWLNRFEAFGATFWACLLLFGGLCWRLRYLKEQYMYTSIR